MIDLLSHPFMLRALLAAGEGRDAVGRAVGQAVDLEGVGDGAAVGAGQRPQQAAAAEPAGGDDLPLGCGDAGGSAHALGHEADA